MKEKELNFSPATRLFYLVSKTNWIIAFCLSFLVVVSALLYSAWQLSRENLTAKNELEKMKGEMETVKTELTSSREELERTALEIKELERGSQETLSSQEKLKQEMQAALESKEVTISELQGKLSVNILDRVLFDSGEADLRPEGERILQQVASLISSHTNRQIQVHGHTDNVPIRHSPKGRHATNWELSAARALAAVRFLSEKAGVRPELLSAVGFGEYHPAASNATPEGRARNRRIALIIMPEELALSDAILEKRKMDKKPRESEAIESSTKR